MRIGEKKQIIEEVLSEDHRIHIESEAIYAGQAYRIDNYASLIKALDIIAEENWNEQSYEEIEEIKRTKGVTAVRATVDNTQFNQISSYVNTINSKVPLYYSIINSLTEEQDEKAINIKLPEDISSLGQLSSFNKRIDDILKLVNVDGGFEVKGFDKGTDWYTLCATGTLSYYFFIGCLKIAQEYFKTKKEYFQSEEARLSYEASLKETDTSSDDGFEKHKEAYLDRLIQKKVEETIESIGATNGRTIPELTAHLVKATTLLVKEFDKGTEFHLSLNPPKEVSESGGGAILQIDYKSLQPKIVKKSEALGLPAKPKRKKKPKS